MKKTSILIAMFAVIAAASVANAQTDIIDFDGRDQKATSFMEAIRQQDSCGRTAPSCATGDIIPGRPAHSVSNGNRSAVYSLDKAGKQAFIKALPTVQGDLLPQTIVSLAEGEKTGILYNDKKVFFVNDINKDNFSIVAESSDSRVIKILLGINKSQFTARALGYADIGSRRPIPVCTHTHVEQRCNYQLVCEMVCGAAAGAAGAGAGPLGSAVIGAGAVACVKVCSKVPDCQNVDVCDEWGDSV